MRSSKELAVRLRFDRIPGRDFFRRHYLATAIAAAGLAAAGWAGMTLTGGERAYLPGAVTPNHATFGDRCENCHDVFGGVTDDACQACHPGHGHSEFADVEATCASCHVEHQGEPGMLAVRDGACTGCHADLASTRAEPAIAAGIDSFASHPEFTPLRGEARDGAAIRFNHRLHLTSTRVATAEPDGEACDAYRPPTCTSCHRVATTGDVMEPIRFDRDCACCHEQVVTSEIGSVTAPHADPAAVRAALEGGVLAIGVERAESIFEGSESVLPGVRGRGPVDESKSLREFRSRQVAVLERDLYAPLDAQKPLFDHNTKCFLCHDAERPYGEDGSLPEIAEPGIPGRWLRYRGFAHRKHAMMECRDCHAEVEQSEETIDVGIPPRELCETCHHDDRPLSAGTDCVLCHLYHDDSRDPLLRQARRAAIPTGVLLGREAPSRPTGAAAE